MTPPAPTTDHHPDGPALQCTTVVLLPPPAHVTALAPPGRPPEAGYLLCELAHHHTGPHAAMLWDEPAPHHSAVWAHWATTHAHLTPHPWCGTLHPHDPDHACHLYTGHPTPHSWNITDPTDHAITHHLHHTHHQHPD